MKLHRLRVGNFAGVQAADIAFGPGLNVLYGPNDLGKSTLVEAIRLALLLPHGSTSCDQYIAWTGGRDPMVELTFETDRQRIWRVRKEFGRSGSSLLQESKDGVDFDDVERARKVDGKLRDILRWGIPEPGGSGGSKGIPTSFLATALLSTQADVDAMLQQSLQDDPSGSGKEQIAAALQAIAQDPLFVELLRSTQARRDEAYTDRGAKKTAKGSVFKVAADRVRDTRDEKEKLQRIVSESEATEKSLRDLLERRQKGQEALTLATEQLTKLERLAIQAGERDASAEQVRLAQEEVERIRRIGADVEEAQRRATDLLGEEKKSIDAAAAAQRQHAEADNALKASEEAARAEGSDSSTSDTVVRQELELRKAAAEKSASGAQQRIDVVATAQTLVDDAAEAEREHRDEEVRTEKAHEYLTQVAATEKAADDELRQCDLLERGLDVRIAEKQLADAQALIEKQTAIQAHLDAVLKEQAAFATQRATLLVPKPSELVLMRRLANEMAAARGALDVGLAVTLIPARRLEVSIRKDGSEVQSTSTERALEIEAATVIELGIADTGSVHIRGGRRDAQDKARKLEGRWTEEVLPHFAAAGVTDLDSLETKVAEAQQLDASIKAKDTEASSLRAQLDPLSGASEQQRLASQRAETCRATLGNVALETLSAQLDGLGVDPLKALRKRRADFSRALEAAGRQTRDAATAHTIAQERSTNLRSSLNMAILRRDAALASLPEGLAVAQAAARADLAAATEELQSVEAQLGSLENTIAERKQRVDKALSGARAKAEAARSAVKDAQEKLTEAVARSAEHSGRLAELRRQRDAEDLKAAEKDFTDARQRYSALPVPERNVTQDEVSAAKDSAETISLQLDGIEREVQRAHGALEQVGGAVARERLQDAIEAFELAEQQEREIEADYEAWKLLLDQMKEADAAQASNLGQTLGPAIASRFQTLTRQRYQSVQLNAQLGTEGIVTASGARPAARLSVGTREQLSTLYRLALAEYLHAAVVLDDQLVQSDESRMDWFRALLAEKAHIFQIIVFTCRPGDYLPKTSIVPDGPDVHVDTDNGFLRAINLEKVLGQAQATGGKPI